MARVFISHSSRDNTAANEIKTWLSDEGFDSVFLDFDKHAGIPPGEDWERLLYRRIESAQAMILILTPNWHDSKWCFVEFAQARALGKAIFPVVFAPDSQRYVAADIQQLDIRKDREGGLERLANELTRLAIDAQGGFAWNTNRPPYPGLMAFEEDDAAVFFGRDDEVRAVIERLNATRVRGYLSVTILLGASGSGKSSVLRAGVLPRLQRDRRNWVVLPPFRPRLDPIPELARAGCEALGRLDDWPQLNAKLLSKNGPAALRDLAQEVCLRAGDREAQLLISIDQGEELFTTVSWENTKRFLRLLEEAGGVTSRVTVLLALRSDYLDRFQIAADSLPFNEFPLRPFPHERVRQIIEGPARVAGISVSNELIDRAIVDMGTNDALPLLAFMLRELYDRFSSGRTPTSPLELTLAHYQSLTDGSTAQNPLESAVQKRANDILASMRLSDNDLAEVREAFVSTLVRIDDEGQYARQPAPWDEIPTRAQPLLEELSKARLVVMRTDETGRRTVEVAHEALLRKWELLRRWLDAERDFIRGRAQLRESLKDWIGTGPSILSEEKIASGKRDNTALLTGLQLSRARQWLAEHPNALSPDERAFINASSVRSMFRRGLAGLGAVLLAIAVVGSLLLWRDQRITAARATAASLSVQARSSLHVDPLRAVELASDAVDTFSSADSRSILLESILSLSPYLEKVHQIGGGEPKIAFEDGSTVAIGDDGGEVIFWRPFTEEPTKSLQGPTSNLRASDFNNESRVLDLAWRDNSLVSLRASGHVVFSEHRGPFKRVVELLGLDQASRGSIAPADKFLVAQTASNDVRYFDCSVPQQEGTSQCAGRVVVSGNPDILDLDDRGELAALAFETGRLSILSMGRTITTKVVQLEAAAAGVASLSWSGGGTHLAIGTVDGRVLVVNPEGEVLAEAPRQRGSVTALAWDFGSARLASVCDPMAICVWEVLQSNEGMSLNYITRFHGHSNVITAVAFSPDGRRLASAGNDHTSRLWLIDNINAQFATIETKPEAVLTDLSASDDGRWLAAGDEEGGVHIWSLKTLSSEVFWDGGGSKIAVITWLPWGPSLAFGDAAGNVTIRSWPRSEEPRHFSVDGPLSAMIWLRDGSGLLTGGGYNGAINSIMIDGGRQLTLEKRHQDAVLGLALSPDGTLVSVDALGKIGLENLQTQSAFEMRSSGASRDSVAFDPDGKRFLLAGNDGDLQVFTLSGNQLPTVCTSASQQLDGAIFGHPDGRIVAAISSDAILHLWELADDCELVASAPLPVEPGERRNVSYRPKIAFIPGRNAVAIVHSTASVVLVPLDPNIWLSRARSISRTVDQL